MSTFAVILNRKEEAESVKARIEQEYPEPDHIALNETAWLLSGDFLIKDIAEKIGLREGADEPAAGMVLRLTGT